MPSENKFHFCPLSPTHWEEDCHFKRDSDTLKEELHPWHLSCLSLLGSIHIYSDKFPKITLEDM